jgi:hypothetical protein
MNADDSSNDTYKQTGKKIHHNYIYLYLLRPEEGGDGRIDVYFVYEEDPIIPDLLYVQKLVEKADRGLLRACGSAMSDLAWRFGAYLIFAMNRSRYRFQPDDGVEFIFTEAPKDNHSFFDGYDFPDKDGHIFATVCMNHRLNVDGDVLGGSLEQTEVYEVNFNTIPPLPVPLHEETGSNTGP